MKTLKTIALAAAAALFAITAAWTGATLAVTPANAIAVHSLVADNS
jgi:hypothetical protein